MLREKQPQANSQTHMKETLLPMNRWLGPGGVGCWADRLRKSFIGHRCKTHQVRMQQIYLYRCSDMGRTHLFQVNCSPTSDAHCAIVLNSDSKPAPASPATKTQTAVRKNSMTLNSRTKSVHIRSHSGGAKQGQMYILIETKAEMESLRTLVKTPTRLFTRASSQVSYNSMQRCA